MNDLNNLPQVSSDLGQLINEQDVVTLIEEFDKMPEEQKQIFIDQCTAIEQCSDEPYPYDTNVDSDETTEEEDYKFFRLKQEESIRKFKEKFPNGAVLESGEFLE